MNPQPLYDLSPLLRLMLAGAVLAVGPMVWVWVRNRGASPVNRLHALTLITLFLTFDLVLFGAFTRLTDSGLGCPDWPGCYGNASPLGAHADIAVAQSAMPTGPVTRGKAWIEMVHRYLATGVGVLILVIAVANWLTPGAKRLVSPWWATATLAWVCVQGAFGALTVTMKLFPAIVTLHLMGALLLLALLCVQVVRHSQWQGGANGLPPASQPISLATRTLLWLTFTALVVQVALGGWVSTNYAVLACNEFPRCQASWWPQMNFEQGFEVWRKLGLTGQGEHIGFAALTAIHYVHRMMAGVLLLLVGALAWQLNGLEGMRAPSRWLALLIGLQLATGLSNVVLGWPLLAALLHTGGAAALVIVMTWAACISQAVSARAASNANRLTVSRLNA
jgi:cytochrome c oxidase assembly protein subunit 15